jgi:hypothetical protein
MVKFPQTTPKGPSSDAFETKNGPEAVSSYFEEQRRQGSPLSEATKAEAKTAARMQEDALEALGRVSAGTTVKEPVLKEPIVVGSDGVVIARFDRERDGNKVNRPVGVGGRAL